MFDADLTELASWGLSWIAVVDPSSVATAASLVVIFIVRCVQESVGNRWRFEREILWSSSAETE